MSSIIRVLNTHFEFTFHVGDYIKLSVANSEMSSPLLYQEFGKVVQVQSVERRGLFKDELPPVIAEPPDGIRFPFSMFGKKIPSARTRRDGCLAFQGKNRLKENTG